MNNIKYLLIDKSAIEIIVRMQKLQSKDFLEGKRLVDTVRGQNYTAIKNLFINKNKDGVIIAGSEVSKDIIVFDYTQCKILDDTTDSELLQILQKTSRFAVRYWYKHAYTPSEKIFDNKAVVFPFPFALKDAYRLTIMWSPLDERSRKRGFISTLLVHGFGTGIPSNADDSVNLEWYKKSCEKYHSMMHEIRAFFRDSSKTSITEKDNEPIHYVKTDSFYADKSFEFLSYDKQISLLTEAQKQIVECEDIGSPIRIEGPAGTGKTIAMVLRAITLLKKYNSNDEKFVIKYVTHSKSTEYSVKELFNRLLGDEILKFYENGVLEIETLQDYCINFINFDINHIIDIDASDSKQYQLELIEESFLRCNSAFNTFKPYMSQETVDFFSNDYGKNIFKILQYEFSVRIKGLANSSIEAYKNLKASKNGIPLINKYDYEYVYRIFNDYQSALQQQGVYDTDDIMLEALLRLNGPIWRRKCTEEGVNYLFVDEMHLFNLNEQNIFHLMTKEANGTHIPICFALDYAQAIGDRGDISSCLKDKFDNSKVFNQKLETVFRNSPYISDLCAAITSSGALLFDGFINPYTQFNNGFTSDMEKKCDKPKLIMYEHDAEMYESLKKHITDMKNRYKCQLSDIAIIVFNDESFLDLSKTLSDKYEIEYINGRIMEHDFLHNKIICSQPEYVNGLEFKCIILVGVDEGRVPLGSSIIVSDNYLKYSALNKLYIACSRAKYSVLILGTKVYGESSCLRRAIENKFIDVEINE